MNKTIVTLGTALFFVLGSATFISCGGGQEHAKEGDHHEHELAVVYQCPMQCEGDKTYAEADKCPSCGMDLEVLEARDHDEANDHEHDHEHEHEHNEVEHDH